MSIYKSRITPSSFLFLQRMHAAGAYAIGAGLEVALSWDGTPHGELVWDRVPLRACSSVG